MRQNNKFIYENLVTIQWGGAERSLHMKLLLRALQKLIHESFFLTCIEIIMDLVGKLTTYYTLPVSAIGVVTTVVFVAAT